MKAKFSKGQSIFKCRVCGRNTRDVEDNGGVELCPQCYTIAGIENSVLDGCETVESVRVEVERLAAEVRAKGGTPDVDFLSEA